MPDQRKPLIVGIQGSPRLEGNSAILLDAALQGAAEAGATTLKFNLNELNIRPCQGCGGCDKTGKCIIRDDMNLIYEAFEKMDSIVLASPVYFGGVTAQTKAMIDRCQALWVRKHVLKTPVAADNHRRDLLFLSVLGQETEDLIRGIRTNVKGFLDTVTQDGDYIELIFPKVEYAGEISDHWEAIGSAREAGARLV